MNLDLNVIFAVSECIGETNNTTDCYSIAVTNDGVMDRTINKFHLYN